MTMHPSSGTPSMIDHIIPPRPQRSGSVHPLHPLLSPMYAPGVSDGHDEVVKLLGYRIHLSLLCMPAHKEDFILEPALHLAEYFDFSETPT